jgi:hypothetical protein
MLNRKANQGVCPMNSSRPRYEYCPRIGRSVSTELTEGQCRDLNGCGEEPCPLEGDLGQRKPGHVIELLASSFAISLSRPERSGDGSS